MGEGNTAGEYFRKVRELHVVKKFPSGEKVHVTTGGRLKKYAKTWWHERGGPGGVTDEYLKSIAAIHGAIPPGTTEEFFQSKIQPILEVRAKAAGYAAMVGDVVTAAIVNVLFVQGGRRLSQKFARSDDSPMQRAMNLVNVGQSVAVKQDEAGTLVLDNSGKVLEGARGMPEWKKPKEDKRVASDNLDLEIGLRVGGILAGIAAGAVVIERGPVHAVAKLSAKVEGAAGAAVVKIVDRIVKGWDQADVVR